jgi:3-hydroxyacyl-CoA dehydrogenase
MEDHSRRLRRAAVLGSGVMGAQIAAHLANAGLPVRLFELPAKDGDRNATVHEALKGLTRLKPSPLASASTLQAIEACNYDDHLDRLGDSDLVIEAITERLDWKRDLYDKIAPHLGERTVLATNTSGLGIARLSEVLPERLRHRFCGTHFFNPPRYMHLLELIPHAGTDPDVLDRLEAFFTSRLGKGVIRAKDTPSFIGNRIGVFSMLAVMHHTERLGLPLDLVDKLTGAGIGRPKSATFRTADVVGLDTFAHVVNASAEALTDDPWRDYYRVPDWMQGLIDNGALGQKTGVGFYRKEGRDIHVLDPERLEYRRVRSWLDERVRVILNERDTAKKFAALADCDHPQAEFLLSIYRDLFHYCAVHLGEIAHSARDVDLAMRWGYGWLLGPFETWQGMGWGRVAETLGQAIAAGRTMTDVPLPDWVDHGREVVHTPAGSWSAEGEQFVPRSDHPVYRRQVFRERVVGEPEPDTATVFETEAVRCWHTGDDIAVLGFKTKMHTVDDAVLDGVLQAVETAERGFKALVLWQRDEPFCAGANLMQVLGALQQGRLDTLREIVRRFQQATMALRHSQVPTVAAVRGLALGGGCELLLHADRAVAALESYIGLVEVGVGLIPAAGGSKELAQRASDEARGGDVFPHIARYFERAAMAKVAGSAAEAREMGYLSPADTIVFNPHELLYVAKRQAEALYESGYHAPTRRSDIRVAGAPGIATLKAQLVNMREGGFISEHDFEIGSALARVMCGGEVDPGSEVSDAWLLKLELETFMALLETERTQDRVRHMLETGRPLRN